MRKLSRNAVTFMAGLAVATLGPIPAVAQITIIADSAFETFGTGGVGTGANDGIGDMGIGDISANQGRRGVARFSLAGLAGQILQSATLNLTISQSRRDQFCESANPITDSSPPFTNPGLGDTNVVHIADPGTPDAADYGSPSLGNDPGLLIAAGDEPPSAVAIDVTAAVRDSINSGSAFVAFRIQTVTETDLDDCNDVWFVLTEESTGQEPFILATTGPFPGSTLTGVALDNACEQSTADSGGTPPYAVGVTIGRVDLGPNDGQGPEIATCDLNQFPNAPQAVLCDRSATGPNPCYQEGALPDVNRLLGEKVSVVQKSPSSTVHCFDIEGFVVCVEFSF